MKSKRSNENSGRSWPQWELYERLVARLVADQISTEYCVTPNARIQGRISGQQRQLDVLIDLRHETDNKRRIIIDAKARGRRIDVTHVEAFRGLMTDVEATHGYLVCPAGWTDAAHRRAQEAVSIRLLPLDRLENFDPSTWPQCLETGCNGGRVFWDGYPCFDMTLAPLQRGAKMLRLSYVHYVGKCDKCSRFHVKCMTCSEMLALDHLAEDEGARCHCQAPWWWLASVERDEQDRLSAELHAVRGIGQIATVSRRSL